VSTREKLQKESTLGHPSLIWSRLKPKTKQKRKRNNADVLTMWPAVDFAIPVVKGRRMVWARLGGDTGRRDGAPPPVSWSRRSWTATRATSAAPVCSAPVAADAPELLHSDGNRCRSSRWRRRRLTKFELLGAWGKMGVERGVVEVEGVSGLHFIGRGGERPRRKARRQPADRRGDFAACGWDRAPGCAASSGLVSDFQFVKLTETTRGRRWVGLGVGRNVLCIEERKQEERWPDPVRSTSCTMSAWVELKVPRTGNFLSYFFNVYFLLLLLYLFFLTRKYIGLLTSNCFLENLEKFYKIKISI
jgi:hypothetical protein